MTDNELYKLYEQVRKIDDPYKNLPVIKIAIITGIAEEVLAEMSRRDARKYWSEIQTLRFNIASRRSFLNGKV